MKPSDDVHPRTRDGGRGIDVRTYLAALAMQGLLAGVDATPEDVAEDAVRFADALLRRLNGATSKQPVPQNDRRHLEEIVTRAHPVDAGKPKRNR